MSQPPKTLAASGIEQLIERLRADGVDKGREQAEQVLQTAQAEAKLLLQQARAEVQSLREAAERDIAQQQQASQDALKMAARDVLLAVKEDLSRHFADRVERMIAQQMDNAEFMQRLILELVGQVRLSADLDQVPRLDVLLPAQFIGLDELRRHADEYSDGPLSQFVQSVTAEMLREGVHFSTHGRDGIAVRMHERDIEVDLSQEAIASLLLQHLQPRFRALLEGVIR